MSAITVLTNRDLLYATILTTRGSMLYIARVRAICRTTYAITESIIAQLSHHNPKLAPLLLMPHVFSVAQCDGYDICNPSLFPAYERRHTSAFHRPLYNALLYGNLEFYEYIIDRYYAIYLRMSTRDRHTMFRDSILVSRDRLAHRMVYFALFNCVAHPQFAYVVYHLPAISLADPISCRSYRHFCNAILMTDPKPYGSLETYLALITVGLHRVRYLDLFDRSTVVTDHVPGNRWFRYLARSLDDLSTFTAQVYLMLLPHEPGNANAIIKIVLSYVGDRLLSVRLNPVDRAIVLAIPQPSADVAHYIARYIQREFFHLKIESPISALCIGIRSPSQSSRRSHRIF